MSNSLPPHGLYCPWNSPDQNTGVGSLFLLQKIFPTQDRTQVSGIAGRLFYQLSHQESPRIMEWVAYEFSRGIFLTQESNRGLRHCRQILYQLSYQGSLHIHTNHLETCSLITLTAGEVTHFLRGFKYKDLSLCV